MAGAVGRGGGWIELDRSLLSRVRSLGFSNSREKRAAEAATSMADSGREHELNEGAAVNSAGKGAVRGAKVVGSGGLGGGGRLLGFYRVGRPSLSRTKLLLLLEKLSNFIQIGRAHV